MATKADFTNPKVQMKFAELAWIEVAPFAYRKYLEKGRGGLLIDAAGITMEELDRGAKIDSDAKYVTIEDDQVPDEIKDRMKRYDPETEIFFLFNVGTGLSTFYGKVFKEQSPKELFEAK